MRLPLTLAISAVALVPVAAQAVPIRPAVATYAAPVNLGVGARVGAATGKKMKFDDDGHVIGALGFAAVGFGAGYLLGHRHHRTVYVYVPTVSPD